MAFKQRHKDLKEVVSQLRSAVNAHGKQADIIEKHIDDMEDSPMTKKECGPYKKKGPCWEGYEMIGMKNKGGRKVPNCVPKNK
tara:strand:+ start:152 stop:400 length:249 start_codon:yes stop_codon:yes gene_type:complete